MDNAFFFIVLIVVVIVLATLTPRWVRRTSSSAGRRTGRRYEEERLTGILTDLGATVVLHTSPETARDIVDAVAGADARRFAILYGGGYGIRFLDEDDAVARLVPDADGIRLQVEQFTEYLGMPNTAGFWGELREGVEAAADARGVQTTAGPTAVHVRDASGRWALDA